MRILVMLVLAIVACSSTRDTLQSRFARERSCPEDEVRVEEAGGNQYRAKGCGLQAVYVCGATAGFGNPGAACAEQGVNRRAPPEAGGPRVPPPDPRLQEPR